MKASTREVNFDGLVGPTHNYSGLSYGNVASLENQYAQSNPREAALQGLEKMKFLADKGLVQAVLPPQQRPHLPTLRSLGFSGTDQAILLEVSKKQPELLLAVSSAASMWTANAATVSPSVDSHDNKVHVTPANLTSKFHRSIEPETTAAVFKAIFGNEQFFKIHEALPAGYFFADEGAANHTRFCHDHGTAGIQLFVYGRSAFQDKSSQPKRFPARQTLEASQAVSRLHALNPKYTVFAQQRPEAIDAGAFHNDVVSVGNGNLFLYHQEAFLNQDAVIAEIKTKMADFSQTSMNLIEVKSHDISLEQAISTYLFNSQILTMPDGKMIVIAPTECQENEAIRTYLEQTLRAHSISEVHYLNLRQSMRNGGGPACLRLRIALTQQEMAAANQGVFLDDKLYHQLKAWINKHYRDRLQADDLADPKLLDESNRALDELTKILHIGPIYPFQAA